MTMEDAAGFFANVFGGERFMAYVSRSAQRPFTAGLICLVQIGEISLMKEMTSVATTMMTEEEKAEVEKQMNAGSSNGATPGLTTTPHHETEPKPAPTTDGPSGSGGGSPVEGGDATSSEHHRTDKKRAKLTPEQKKKLEEMEAHRKKAMEERVETLTKQLIERLRPFVDAENPGERSDPETQAFEDKMRREAEDMKLESFGVEVRFSSNHQRNC